MFNILLINQNSSPLLPESLCVQTLNESIKLIPLNYCIGHQLKLESKECYFLIHMEFIINIFHHNQLIQSKTIQK